MGLPQAVRHIFQIAYDERFMYRRAALLRDLGHKVHSVVGNKAALDTLSSWPNYDLFIIGTHAPESTRVEMERDLLGPALPGLPAVAL